MLGIESVVAHVASFDLGALSMFTDFFTIATGNISRLSCSWDEPILALAGMGWIVKSLGEGRYLVYCGGGAVILVIANSILGAIRAASKKLNGED